MGKIWVEICLISARGLTRTSSLWKLQWFAVGWINPDNKYCTKIDASGNANPVWKTKFSASVDSSGSGFKDLALNVEVYSREPVFLREKLQGTATVVLKEFVDKHSKNSESVEDVGSFQLRKRNSDKPQGFVDVSIRISEEKDDESNTYQGLGDAAGIKLRTRTVGFNSPPPIRHPENHPQMNIQYDYPRPTNYFAGPPAYPSAGGFTHQPLQTPPLPPGPNHHQQPPLPPNVGYMPTFPPKTNNLPPGYVNMPPSSSGRNGGGFGMGLGAGALAAGAVIFGEDFMSGFDLPTSVTLSTDPPF